MIISIYALQTFDRMCFPGGSVGKESTCNVGDGVQFLGQEDPLEKEMAPHSSTLAWRVPWTEEPGGLQSMGLQRVRHDLATKPPPYMYILSYSVSASAQGKADVRVSL